MENVIETDEVKHASEAQDAGDRILLELTQRLERGQRKAQITSGVLAYDGPPLNHNIEDIMDILKRNTDGTFQARAHSTEKNWSLADLFVRQYLNNLTDGFGMYNVEEMYMYLRAVKDKLIQFDMISKDGFNNSGYPLWKDYNF
tara:strand:- start:7459 stop:7890 length:432 start_codon:yes stop_codon:yes gene_type:complete